MSGVVTPQLSCRRPVLSRVGAGIVAFVATIASTLLIGLNAFVALLTCGDDGPLDYGTGGETVRNYCQASFDDGANVSSGFTALSVLVFALAGVTGTLLFVTRQRLWLYSSLTVLALLAAWALWLVVIL